MPVRDGEQVVNLREREDRRAVGHVLQRVRPVGGGRASAGWDSRPNTEVVDGLLASGWFCAKRQSVNEHRGCRANSRATGKRRRLHGVTALYRGGAVSGWGTLLRRGSR